MGRYKKSSASSYPNVLGERSSAPLWSSNRHGSLLSPQCSRQTQSRVLQLQEFPGSKCSAPSGSDCYTRSTGTSPYCQLRPNCNVVVCSNCGSFPLRRNSDFSSFSLYSVRLLGMRQHILQPFIFHLDINIVKESLHYQ